MTAIRLSFVDWFGELLWFFASERIMKKVRSRYHRAKKLIFFPSLGFFSWGEKQVVNSLCIFVCTKNQNFRFFCGSKQKSYFYILGYEDVKSKRNKTRNTHKHTHTCLSHGTQSRSYVSCAQRSYGSMFLHTPKKTYVLHTVALF